MSVPRPDLQELAEKVRTGVERQSLTPLVRSSAHNALDALLAECVRLREERDYRLVDHDVAEKRDALAREVAALREYVEKLREALISTEAICPDCDGARWMDDGECGWCGATGKVLRDATEITEIVRAALALPVPEGGGE